VGALLSIVLWAAYSTVISVVAASDFEVALFLVFIPAHLALGFFTSDMRATLLPPLLTILLGWLTYEAACPCYEDGIGVFYWIWGVYFALPGVLLVPVGVGIRRATAPRGA
jgi:hypothetical protein